ncbi:hypothetical protein B0H12DRAFT_1154561 [Mycena haematopus]|nr:hypothetical protein B0H12DRAFT_1154561 [Mycena haematopus]
MSTTSTTATARGDGATCLPRRAPPPCSLACRLLSIVVAVYSMHSTLVSGRVEPGVRGVTADSPLVAHRQGCRQSVPRPLRIIAINTASIHASSSLPLLH